MLTSLLHALVAIYRSSDFYADNRQKKPIVLPLTMICEVIKLKLCNRLDSGGWALKGSGNFQEWVGLIWEDFRTVIIAWYTHNMPLTTIHLHMYIKGIVL